MQTRRQGSARIIIALLLNLEVTEELVADGSAEGGVSVASERTSSAVAVRLCRSFQYIILTNDDSTYTHAIRVLAKTALVPA